MTMRGAKNGDGGYDQEIVVVQTLRITNQDLRMKIMMMKRWETEGER